MVRGSALTASFNPPDGPVKWVSSRWFTAEMCPERQSGGYKATQLTSGRSGVETQVGPALKPCSLCHNPQRPSDPTLSLYRWLESQREKLPELLHLSFSAPPLISLYFASLGG